MPTDRSENCVQRRKWIQWDGLLLFARNLPEIVRVEYGGGSLPDDVATGYTITPGKEFNLTMKDMCSPDMKVTFRPNKKDPRYDDLVGIYAGKEAFRYKQIK